MKKVIFFLLAALTFINVEAQTYEQTQRKISKEISRLNASLNEINDKIYYLEVDLGKKLNDTVFNKKLSPSYLSNLKKEKFFSKDDLISLKIKKTEIEKTLAELTKVSLASTEARIKADLQSNLPERMRRREYNERMRRLLLEGGDGKLFRGLLINNKSGVNETATFIISNNLVCDTPQSFTLDPRSRKEVFLPAGEYKMKISCGNFYSENVFHVEYRTTHFIGNETVYFGAEKKQCDF